MSENKSIYKGPQIELDLEAKRFKRESDQKWRTLPAPKYLALTQRKMSQMGGLRGTFNLHKYNAFCVYLKAGKLNILAFMGTRDKVEKEAAVLAEFLDVEIQDLFPRDEQGNVVDDDYGQSSTNYYVIVVALIVAICLILAFLSD